MRAPDNGQGDDDQILQALAADTHVKQRARGVIGLWITHVLTGNLPGDLHTTVDLADQLITAMNRAGLQTFIAEDLRAFIADIKAR